VLYFVVFVVGGTLQLINFVPQQEAWVIERMGKFHDVLEPVSQSLPKRTALTLQPTPLAKFSMRDSVC
jgi:regulator of protease activity HflC (stomatin/prohibitin superfamily)